MADRKLTARQQLERDKLAEIRRREAILMERCPVCLHEARHHSPLGGVHVCVGEADCQCTLNRDEMLATPENEVSHG